MNGRSWMLACSALTLSGCLWQSSLGEVEAPDSGAQPAGPELENFALSLLGGTFVGTGGADDIRVEQTFFEDGSYEASCLGGESTTPAVFCPFYGVTGKGRYQLTGIEVSGAVNASTWDTQLGVEVESHLNYMRLTREGDTMTLTYVRVATLNGTIASLAREAGIPLSDSGSTSLQRNYVVLTRRP